MTSVTLLLGILLVKVVGKYEKTFIKYTKNMKGEVCKKNQQEN